MWVNMIEGISSMNPPANELKKLSMAYLHLKGIAYDWFTWWHLLKKFHDDEEDDTFTKFAHLCQMGTFNEYTHDGKSQRLEY
jgi:hypothetical protein